MRALYLDKPSEFFQNEIIVDDSSDVHYLGKVLRLRVGEDLLVLDGTGMERTYQIQEIQKRQVVLKLQDEKLAKRKSDITIYLGTPKKEYFEECLRVSVQMGVKKLVLIDAEYSQFRPDLNDEKQKARYQKILKGSYEQSNNPFQLELDGPKSLNHVLENLGSKKHYLMTLNRDAESGTHKSESFSLFIGPEAGFSKNEEEKILAKDVVGLNLKSYILKTYNAISSGIGSLLK
ncbi:MAG: 16S rRNA (uracil(1498)-N(3))-methyltransferase [Bacteriovoracaceae bacterium]